MNVLCSVLLESAQILKENCGGILVSAGEGKLGSLSSLGQLSSSPALHLVILQQDNHLMLRRLWENTCLSIAIYNKQVCLFLDLRGVRGLVFFVVILQTAH